MKTNEQPGGFDGIDADDAAEAKSRAARPPEWFMLGVILVTAALVRFMGLTWGLPDSLHTFSYHPDETVVLIHTCPAVGGINLFSDHVGAYVLPHFYNYGSLQLYLINIATSIAAGYGYIHDIITNTGQFNTESLAHFYLVGRLLTVLMGVGTVWVVWAAAKRVWGMRAAYFAAFTLAVMPLHAQHSHFMTVDVPAAFWVSLSLYWSLRVLKDDGLFAAKLPRSESKPKSESETGAPFAGIRPRMGVNPWIMAGLFAGLAMATKYNAALVILPLFVAGHFRRKENFAGALKGMAQGVAAFVLAFVAACPGSVLETHYFLRDIAFEGNHVYQHGEPEFQRTGLGWVYILTHNLSVGMGWPMLILSLVAVAFALWRRRPEDWVLLAFALSYYLLMGAAQSRYARYEIPLLPALALWLGSFAQFLAPNMNPVPGIRSRRKLLDVCARIVLLGSVLPACYTSMGLIQPMEGTDPRDQAIAKLGDVRSHTYGFATVPWFYTPPLDPEFTLPGPGQWIARQTRWPATHLFYNPVKPFDADTLRATKPDYVLLSEFEYTAPLRLRDPDALAYIAELRRSYGPPVICGGSVSGVRSSMEDGLPVHDLPHDMLYPCPNTLIFQRKAP